MCYLYKHKRNILEFEMKHVKWRKFICPVCCLPNLCLSHSLFLCVYNGAGLISEHLAKSMNSIMAFPDFRCSLSISLSHDDDAIWRYVSHWMLMLLVFRSDLSIQRLYSHEFIWNSFQLIKLSTIKLKIECKNTHFVSQIDIYRECITFSSHHPTVTPFGFGFGLKLINSGTSLQIYIVAHWTGWLDLM